MSLVVAIAIDDARLNLALARLSGAGQPDHPALRNACAAAAIRYLSFIRRRFVSASRGDGTWPDLALSTKLARARRAAPAGRRKMTGRHSAAARLAGRRFAILRDTGTLFASLSVGAPGSVAEPTPAGFRVGTAVRYARYHQQGAPERRLPQRAIFVPPDEPTSAAMYRTVLAGLRQAVSEAMSPAIPAA